MATRTRNTRKNTGQRAEIEEWLDGKGVKWAFVPNVSPDAFDEERSLRNQARITQVLSEERVETYTEAMERGDQFPAVVAYEENSKYIMIDGNHRLMSAKNSGNKLGVYIVDPETDPATLVVMTYEANAKHGLPNSVEDRQLHAVFLIKSGADSQERVAASLNLSKAQVQRAWNKAKADDRAHDNGILERQWVQLPVSARLRLSAVRTDEGFNALADLAIQAGLSTDEIDRHVVEINKVRSASGQKKVVEEIKPVYRKRIQQSAGGLMKREKGRGGGPHVMFLMHAGGVSRMEDDIDKAVNGIAEQEISNSIKQFEDAILVYETLVEGLKKRQKGE